MFQKELPRLLRVAGDRRLQRRQTVVLLFVAQLLEEAHAQVLTVKILVAVEEMDFEQRDVDRIDRRSPADAGNTAAEMIHFNDEDTAQRRRTAQDNIRRRKPQSAAELRAVRDAPADRVRMAEEPLGCAQIARLERGAHRRARNPLALELHVRHLLEHEAMPRRGGLEGRKVAGAARAKAKIP